MMGPDLLRELKDYINIRFKKQKRYYIWTWLKYLPVDPAHYKGSLQVLIDFLRKGKETFLKSFDGSKEEAMLEFLKMVLELIVELIKEGGLYVKSYRVEDPIRGGDGAIIADVIMIVNSTEIHYRLFIKGKKVSYRIFIEGSDVFDKNTLARIFGIYCYIKYIIEKDPDLLLKW